MFITKKELLLDLERAGVEMMVGEIQSYMSSLTLEPTLMNKLEPPNCQTMKLLEAVKKWKKGYNRIFM
jgi:hypothetical protein